jgi:D-alanyl-D-alanine carboxypeptidase (penicillin-binding protein 5/6)
VVGAAFRAVTVSCRVAFVLVLAGFAFSSTAAAASQPTVTAQYAVVVDADTGQVLYDKSMNTPTAPASLTKIFTAIYALESSSLDRTLAVSPIDLVGESTMGLAAGDTISLKTALYGMLLPSGNDAAMTVASNLGAEPGDSPEAAVARYVGWLNAMSERLGLQQTHLVNPHGLDQPGHATSAHDLAAITMFALKNAEFRNIIGSSQYTGDGFQLTQANALVGSYSGLIGGKTGITDNAGYSLVEAAERGGHTIITVVLDSTEAAWYQDATTLLDYGFATVGAGALPNNLPVIELQPVVIRQGTLGVAPPPKPAVTPDANATSSTLSVHQVNDNVAVVRHNLLGAGGNGSSWKWPLTSLISMIAVLALAVNYPIVIGAGSLVWKHGKPSRRVISSPMSLAKRSGKRLAHQRASNQRRDARRRRRSVTSDGADGSVADERQDLYAFANDHTAPGLDRSFDEGRFAEPIPANVVSLNAAETTALRAVRLAIRGDYPAATREFERALHSDPTLDLSRASGFWGMQPAGFVAAARAYARTDRTADAKSLLTVIKLSCGTHKELESVLMQVVSPIS